MEITFRHPSGLRKYKFKLDRLELPNNTNAALRYVNPNGTVVFLGIPDLPLDLYVGCSCEGRYTVGIIAPFLGEFKKKVKGTSESGEISKIAKELFVR